MALALIPILVLITIRSRVEAVMPVIGYSTWITDYLFSLECLTTSHLVEYVVVHFTARHIIGWKERAWRKKNCVVEADSGGLDADGGDGNRDVQGTHPDPENGGDSVKTGPAQPRQVFAPSGPPPVPATWRQRLDHGAWWMIAHLDYVARVGSCLAFLITTGAFYLILL